MHKMLLEGFLKKNTPKSKAKETKIKPTNIDYNGDLTTLEKSSKLNISTCKKTPFQKIGIKRFKK